MFSYAAPGCFKDDIVKAPVVPEIGTNSFWERENDMPVQGFDEVYEVNFDSGPRQYYWQLLLAKKLAA